MKTQLGITKKHVNGYEYLSLFPFPAKIRTLIDRDVKILQKANEAQFLLGKLSGITILLPDVDYFISSYITKDATSSSQIEGTKATMVEAFEYAADPANPDDTDADDISHYISALHYGLKRLKEDNFPFSLRFIRELHKELMKGARATHFSDPGEFRKSQNFIGGTAPSNASFVPPAYEELGEALNDLEKFIHSPYIHPIIDAGLLHAQFETVHPFLDGNGRTGRLLITFYLIHYKFLELPTLFLSSYFKRHQKIYYQRLAGYHAGDILPWMDFFLDAVIDTAQQAIEVSKKITKLRDKDLERISTIATNPADTAVRVLQNLYKSPVASTANIEEWTGYTRQGTIKLVDKFIEVGILKLLRKGEGVKPSLYIHREYVNLFEDK
jgi:Fic family protein